MRFLGWKKAITTIIQAIDNVKKKKSGNSITVDRSIDDILVYMHDHPNAEGLSVNINPTIVFQTKIDNQFIDAGNSDKLIDLLMKNLTKTTINGSFTFSSYPRVFRNEFIDISDLLFEIRAFYVAYDLLKQHEVAIRSFDNSVIEEFKNLSAVSQDLSSRNEYTAYT
jgi:hypothetical protein